MAEYSLIGIKKLYYGQLLASVASAYVEGTAGTGLSAAELKAFLAAGTTKQITNIHGDLWNYEEPIPTITEYKNKLSGKTYRADKSKNPAKFVFSVGKSDFVTKAALQGGTANDTKWSAPSSVASIEKTMVALTEDDVYIVMPRASIVGGGKTTDNAVAIALEASAYEPSVTGLEDLVYITKAAVDAVV